jgi:hypothetical protein
VGADVACFDQLYKREPGLVASTKMNDLRRPIALHIDLLDQCFVEVVNGTSIPDR